MEAPGHLLVIRFSALGDIAMTVPVVRNLLAQHPSLQVTFVSVPFVAPLFDGIERLNFIGADIKNEYKGIPGLYRLSRKLSNEIQFDAVADLHDVLRTKIVRFFLGKRKAVIDKGRNEKKELTRPTNKKLHPLKTGFERYAEVFEKLGYPVVLNISDGKINLHGDKSLFPVQKENAVWIGIAPFAKHAAKMYPVGKMKTVASLLLQNPRVHLLVFATKEEVAAIKNWEDGQRLFLMAGRYKLAQELNLMSQLNAMVSMDSANMHLASLVGLPVVSIWGGTHPYLGFYGWGQQMSNAVQSDLPCRPSSVFGNKECPVHGAAGCMQQITPEMIAGKVFELIKD